MLGRLGLQLFTVGLFAFIILYHFFSKIWMIPYVPPVCWALIGVGFILWFIFSIEWIIGWFQKRSSQFGVSVFVSSVAVVAILVVGNWIAIEKNWKKDVTRSKLHSLNEQSIKVLQSLKEPVELEVWTVNLKQMSGSHDMGRFLDNYVQASNGKLKLTVHNPNTERLDAIQKKVTRNDLIIAKAIDSGRESRVENYSDSRAEEQITNAIVQAIKGRKKTLCFIAGHGELTATAAAHGADDQMSLSYLKDALTNSSYSVKDLTTATESKIPDDCEALMSAGPKSAPSDGEIKIITEYLNAGGKLIALWGFEAPAAWQKILDPYGVKMQNNIMIDPRVQGAPAVYTKNFANDSEIVKNFTTPVLFVLARSFDIAKTLPAGVTAKAIVSTETGTFMKEGDAKSLRGGVAVSSLKKAGVQPLAVEIKKPAAVAATTTANNDKDKNNKDKKDTPAKPEAKETEIVVIGNQMFASNGLITQFGNMDFLLNAISSALKDSELIGIRPKDVKSAKLEITGINLRQVQGYLLLTTLVFICLAFLTAFRRKTTIA